ncbi:hypothetical protein B0I35DRAFT_174544 [Stachybotrys elegans]|uniref:Uncharacterized protein n=1 Tax=Stachybotrys elegans TaxID=80388 RepID=A0A8K0SY38_9HYPO|nr:hypothetical protein B0I35DRAFT_174544 [Stachybotrys elegans]
MQLFLAAALQPAAVHVTSPKPSPISPTKDRLTQSNLNAIWTFCGDVSLQLVASSALVVALQEGMPDPGCEDPPPFSFHPLSFISSPPYVSHIMLCGLARSRHLTLTIARRGTAFILVLVLFHISTRNEPSYIRTFIHPSTALNGVRTITTIYFTLLLPHLPSLPLFFCYPSAAHCQLFSSLFTLFICHPVVPDIRLCINSTRNRKPRRHSPHRPVETASRPPVYPPAPLSSAPGSVRIGSAISWLPYLSSFVYVYNAPLLLLLVALALYYTSVASAQSRTQSPQSFIYHLCAPLCLSLSLSLLSTFPSPASRLPSPNCWLISSHLVLHKTLWAWSAMVTNTPQRLSRSLVRILV